jgi:hypothetical protein
MNKKKSCRFQTAKDGSLEIVLPLNPEVVQTAEKTARIIGVDHNEMVLEWFNDLVPCLAEMIEEQCADCATFATREDAEAFLGRLRAAKPWLSSEYVPVETDCGSWAIEYPIEKAQAAILAHRAA